MRAIRVLKEADLVLAEDTRTSSVLLKHFDIRNRLVAHHKFNEHGTSASIVERLKAGETIALISDAGTPGISDPGFYLAREAAKAGITVQTLPGPTACIPAIVSSGLPCDRFCFAIGLAPKTYCGASAVAARCIALHSALRLPPQRAAFFRVSSCLPWCCAFRSWLHCRICSRQGGWT